jgi:hypothetical protein
MVDQTLTYSVAGLVGDDLATIVSGSLARATGENVGLYAINQGTLAAAAGYGYTVSYVPGNMNIAPAALTVSANKVAKVYDGTSYSGGNGVTYIGLVNGETASVLGGTLTYGGAAQGAVNAGTYLLSASGLTSGNYSISYENGALLVTPAALSISGMSASNKVYDGTTTATLLGGALVGLVGNETLGFSGQVGTFSDKNAGVAKAVTVSGVTLADGTGLASNYTIAQPSGLIADITPAPLAVTADEQVKILGNFDPTLTYTTNGLVIGDVLSGALSRDPGEGVGTYAITQGSLANSNYNISFNSADLTITALGSTVIQTLNNTVAAIPTDMNYNEPMTTPMVTSDSGTQSPATTDAQSDGAADEKKEEADKVAAGEGGDVPVTENQTVQSLPVCQ